MTKGLGRRETLKVLLAASAATLVSPVALQVWNTAAAATKQINFGWQKGGNIAVIKARGELEKSLANAGVSISWLEFPAGPQMLEALNVGSIDIGLVGEAPPVFAQAAGTDLLYVANEPPAPHAEKILVLKDSPIKSVAELKGKRIALNKGSNVHFLIVKLLENAGLKYSDVDVAFLTPADARAAFESHSIDAWVIWDPFGAAAESQIGARVLADGVGAANNYEFYIASKDYADKNPDVLNLLVKQLDVEDRWIEQHLKEAAAIVAPQIGLSPDVAELSLSRYTYGVTPLNDTIARQQQEIADVFYDLKLIPKKLDVGSVVWRPTKPGDKS